MVQSAPGSHRLLDILTPLAAGSALFFLTVALATPNWLHTEESIRNKNRTVKFGPDSDPEFLAKRTSSGLWLLCNTQPGGPAYSCLPIDYFPLETYRPDPQDSTNAIPYTATKSCLYFVLSCLILVLGEYFCLAGHLTNKGRLFTFISGVCFILGGLIILMGLIVYISTFKAEVGHKLRTRSALDPPKLRYSYGYSFYILIASFLSSEIAGICAIFQFIYHHQTKWEEEEVARDQEEEGREVGGKTAHTHCQVHTISSGTTNGHLHKPGQLQEKGAVDQKEQEQKQEQKQESDTYTGDSGSSAGSLLLPRGCPCCPQLPPVPHSIQYPCTASQNSPGLAVQYGQQLSCCQGYVSQPPLSLLGQDSADFSSSLCSPTYTVPSWGSSGDSQEPLIPGDGGAGEEAGGAGGWAGVNGGVTAGAETSVETFRRKSELQQETRSRIGPGGGTREGAGAGTGPGVGARLGPGPGPGPGPGQGAGPGAGPGVRAGVELGAGAGGLVYVGVLEQPCPLPPSLASSLQRQGSKRNRTVRHISIDDIPVTHTYQQDSLTDSSEDSNSSVEESSSSTPSGNSCDTSRTRRPNNAALRPAIRTKSVHIRTDQTDLQKIVQQKRENCLQNGGLEFNKSDDIYGFIGGKEQVSHV